MRPVAIFTVALAIWLAASGGADAHTRDRIFSSWTVHGGTVTATVHVPARLMAQFDETGRTDPLVRHFIRTVSVSAGAATCAVTRSGGARTGPDGGLVADLAWTCASAADTARLAIKADALFGKFPNLLHFARFRLPGGRLDEHVFTRSARKYTIDLQSAATKKKTWLGAMTDYAGLGITHILGGADHLAFVLGLILIARGLRALMFIVTGFTLGHSLTLALAATGALTPHSSVVEALIGFTVAIVGVEAADRLSGRGVPALAAALPLAALALAGMVLGSALPAISWAGLVLFTVCYLLLTRHSDSTRWAVALAGMFGLVHGFGFAGVLQEVGLPDDRLIPALFGFNIGVEAGQIMVVALALAIAALAVRRLPDTARLWSAHALAAALCGLGTFWFVSRAFAD